MRKSKRRIALWIALGLCALLAAIWLACTLFSAPALVPNAPKPALLAAAEGLDDIVIEAVFNPDAGSLSVWQRLVLVNRGADARDSAVLRTWPNAFQSAETSPCATDEFYSRCYPNGFSFGALVISEAQAQLASAQKAPDNHAAQGAPVGYRYLDAAKTALLLPLNASWLPGETLTLTLRYTVYVPKAAYRFGVNSDIWALGNAFAIPAVYENGAYRTDAYAPVGDPFLSDCANYTVSITAPEGYQIAGSGEPVAEHGQGVVTYRFSLLAARDFAFTLSERYHAAQAMEGDVLVSAYAQAASAAKEALGYARKALRTFEKLYGAYPYPSLTVSEIDFPLGGMEYPAHVMIASSQLAAGGRVLEYVVAHEVAHQWWYAMVGSDPINQAWQDEALCEFSLLRYTEAVHGRAERDELEATRVESAMRVTVPRGITPGAPLDFFSSMSEYALVVYNRGAAALCALDRAMPSGLDGFLRRYAERFAFSRATRADFEALLAEYTGEDYAPLLTDYLDTEIRN
ncbi:MAG: M1 family metallopeptidase [Clostridia bacterium]